MNARQQILCIVLIIGLVACQPSTHLNTAHAQYAVFGTVVEVKVRHAPNLSVDDTLAELDQLFQQLHQAWHPWAPGTLTQLNAALLTGQWVQWDPNLSDLLVQAQALEQATDGRFNAALGQLSGLWGFHTSHYPILSPPPSAEAIDRLMSTKPSTLEIQREDRGPEGIWVRTTNPSIGLDFSGMAKGAAAELACNLLVSRGWPESLVNLGGDVLVCGPSTQSWRVAIGHPQQGIIEVIEVAERLAVFTSGQYYRYGEWNGKRYAHVLNPATGYPIEHILQATAIHHDAVVADAAATALVVAGVDHAQALSERLRLKQWSVVDEAGEIQWMGRD